MGEKIRLYEKNTDSKALRYIADKISSGAIIIYPTDTTYALGCSLDCIKSINRLKKLKGKDDDNLSLICPDLSNLSDYARVDNSTFKFIKKYTPGAVTFILEASNKIPNAFLNNKKSVGIRVPQHEIILELARILDAPLVSTSIPMRDNDWDTDIESAIWDEYKDKVDIMIDGGSVPNILSTIVDMTSGEAEVIRDGAVDIEI